jgi:hypothetical protein
MENTNYDYPVRPAPTQTELTAKVENLTAQLETAESYARDLTKLKEQVDALLIPSMERYLKGAFADYMRDNSDAFMDLVKDNEYEIRDELDLQDIITESNIEEYQTNDDEIAETVRDTIRDFVRDGTITATLEVK